MSAYETSATVSEQGKVLIAGVPFAPGTEVEVTISVKVPAHGSLTPADEVVLVESRERMRELFGTIHGFRNSPRIPRKELYERGSVH